MYWFTAIELWTGQPRGRQRRGAVHAGPARRRLPERWGYGISGQIGDGANTDRLSPTAVSAYNRGTSPLATYAYNGDGLRAAKTVAGVTKAFTWELSQGVPLLLSDGDRNFVYGPGGRPFAQIDAAGDVTYFHEDQPGSTRLTDRSGRRGVLHLRPLWQPDRPPRQRHQPLGFAGEYTDAETGFVYLGARYYDPATGQSPHAAREPWFVER